MVMTVLPIKRREMMSMLKMAVFLVIPLLEHCATIQDSLAKAKDDTYTPGKEYAVDGVVEFVSSQKPPMTLYLKKDNGTVLHIQQVAVYGKPINVGDRMQLMAKGTEYSNEGKSVLN